MPDHLAWLLLGSNIEPEIHMRRAVAVIAREDALLAVSSVWQSPPADGSAQPDYWNAAVLIRTEKSPEEIHARTIVPIEQMLGRVRGKDAFAPRTIDIDLALYDDRIGEFSGRRIPHPNVLTRAYFALPLAEISPEKVHPQTGEPLQAIAERLRDASIRRRSSPSLLPQESAARFSKR